MGILKGVRYGGQRDIIFSFLIRRSSDSQLFFVKSFNISASSIPIELLQNIGSGAGLSRFVFTVDYSNPSFSVAAYASSSSATFFEGSYPSTVSTSTIDNSDFAPNYTAGNTGVFFDGLWVHDGTWGQAAFSFGGLDFNDFQIQSFDASGAVGVSNGDNPEGTPGPDSLGQLAVRSYILPTVRINAGEFTGAGSGKRVFCKNDLSAVIYILEGDNRKYYDGGTHDLTLGAGVGEVPSNPLFSLWQGNVIYLYQSGSLVIYDVDPSAYEISLRESIPVSLPTLPSGLVIVGAKCEYVAP
jgi:hypothetical protein